MTLRVRKHLSNALTEAEKENAGATNPSWSKMARENEMQEFTRSFFGGRPDLRCTGGWGWGWKGQGRDEDADLTHVSAARSRTPS